MLRLLTMACGISTLFAAPVQHRPVPYGVRTWQTDDGLPQNSVFALAQTPDGYLWVGTREGLARFDGIRFRALEADGAVSLSNLWITALCATADGSLWIGTDANGLARLHDGSLTLFTRTNGLPSDQIRCLLQDRDGALWIGTEEGLARHRAGQFNTYTVRDGLADNEIRAVRQDRLGAIRVATRRGLSTFGRDNRFNAVNFGGGWNRNALRCIAEDRAGNLWIGSADGLHRLAGSEQKTFGGAEGMPDRVINALHVDGAGQLWVGTFGGLARLIDGRVVPWPSEEGVFGDLVYTIFEDNEGGLWAGARDGLHRLTPARFKTYTTEQGLTGNNVTSVCESPAGDIWLGVWGGGLNLLEGDKLTRYGDTNLLRDSILSLCQARDGTLWAGMDFAGGLQRVRDGVRSAYTNVEGLVSAAVRVIHEDAEGNLWVGTRAGLGLRRDGRFHTFGRTNGLPSDSITALCDAPGGGVWIGTASGLSRWRGGTFETVGAGEFLSHAAVNALYADADGTLWVGTLGAGLGRLRDGKAHEFTTRHGLFSDDIYEILEDDFGFFWMSCRRGIFRVARKDLEEVARGERKMVACTSFGKADGLVSVQCSGVAKPAGWKGRDGRLWFPTVRGVIAADSRIKTNARTPPVAIEEVWADKQRVVLPRMAAEAGKAGVRLAPGRGELEIVYSALSLQAAEKNRFKFRLEGVDSSWVDAGTQRSARYNRVAPGSYRFRVIACNNDGVWNEQGAVLRLVLLPHYWQTWWFKAALAAGLVLMLGAGYRARMARIRELEQLRVEIAANLHDDVGARLTKVAMVTEFVDQRTAATDPAKTHVRTIAATTREVIQAMDEIVWTINPKNDTLDQLANYIFQYAEEYFQDTGVRCRLHLPAQLPELAISTEVRHNLFMSVKEALNNVLKHAAASEVRVSLAVHPPEIHLTIVDNGRGFDPASARGVGEGLKNMRDRLAKLGGALAIESRPGAGTTLRMRVEAK